jgi:glycerophosphoryl diester phosphodiesterase
MPRITTGAPLAFVLALAAAAQPLVIAHRGASAYLAEHTLPAYALAYGQGADYLEPDVVLTRDGVLICNHDLTLERKTNVESVFPDRHRDDGKWYAIDFTHAEIKQLTVDVQPRHAREHARLVNPPPLRIATLREMLQLVTTLNQLTGRAVGIIPEPKNAAFHRAAGQPLETALVNLLAEFGYAQPADRCIIQSFEKDALVTIREDLNSSLPLVFLAGNADAIQNAGGLTAIAAFADGLGPNKKLADADHGALIRQARARDLAVYPWTFGADRAELRRFLDTYQVDGLFTDYPDIARAVREDTPQSAATDRIDAIRHTLLTPAQPGVLIVAHRGHHGVAPENSLAAITATAAIGAHLAEIDLRLTSDGHYVLMHDTTVDRTTTGRGKIADLTRAEVQQLHLRDDLRPTTERVPTFEAALAAAAGRVMLNIDLKTGKLADVAAIARHADLLDHCLFKGSWSRLSPEDRAYLAAHPDVIFMPIADRAAQLQEVIATGRYPAVEIIVRNADDPILTENNLQQTHNAGVRAWINTLRDGYLSAGRGDYQAAGDPDAVYTYWVEQGATLLQTDWPDRAVATLRAAGYHLP